MKGYTQLTQEERYQIYVLKKAGHSPAHIAHLLNRSRSTITRELQRNSGQRGYRPKQAQHKAQERRQERAACPRTTTITATTWRQVQDKLQEQWSPEQISGWLHKQQYHSVSHERIYQHIYADKKAGGTLYRNLRCQKQRRKRYGSGRSRRGVIAQRRCISERPAVVETRTRFGDWEVDTIVGKAHQQALVSLVERKSRLVLLHKVERATAQAVQQAVVRLLAAQGALSKVQTITSDNGREFAQHQEIAQALQVEFFFAHPYASWERGSNENANGLVRQYFPKGCDLTQVTAQQVEQVMHRLNHRPRKTLDFLTPHQVFFNQNPVALTP